MLGNECCFEILKFQFEWTLIQIDVGISFDTQKFNFHEMIISSFYRMCISDAHIKICQPSPLCEHLMHITARKRQTKYNFIDPFRLGTRKANRIKKSKK